MGWESLLSFSRITFLSFEVRLRLPSLDLLNKKYSLFPPACVLSYCYSAVILCCGPRMLAHSRLPQCWALLNNDHHICIPKEIEKNKTAGEIHPGRTVQGHGKQHRQYVKHWFQQMNGHLDWLLVTLVLGGCSVCQNPCIHKVVTETAGAGCRFCGLCSRSNSQDLVLGMHKNIKISSISLWPLINTLSLLCSWMRYFLGVRWGY